MCFMQQGIELTEGLTRMTWFLLLLLFDTTNTGKHTLGTQRPIYLHTHSKYILTPTVMCTQQLPVLH